MRRSIVVGCGVALTSLLASSAFAQTPSPPPDYFTIDVVSVIGSGCGTPDDYDVTISPDRTAFTVGYADYAVYSGIDSTTGKPHPLKDHRANCLIGIRVNAPGGFTYGIAETDTRGYMSLRPKANPRAIMSFWFQGLAPTFPVAHYLRQNAYSFSGAPLNTPTGVDTGDFVFWQTTDITPVASIVFNPCGAQRNLEVNTQLQTNQDPTEAESTAGAWSTDGSINTVLHLAWATCP